MTPETLVFQLNHIVGPEHVLTKETKTAYYRSGFRSGIGEACAVVFPGNLLEQWKVLQACVEAKCAIILQAAKTGLTEGSCPSGFDYDRPVVVINIMRIKKIILLDGGRQALTFPGSTLHELEQELKTVNRAPHSVIGSTTIGATVVGGIANNAGGALCKRGSSYTQLSLFAQVGANGRLNLVNRLGIKNLGDTPEAIFAKLESGNIPVEDLVEWDKPASDRDYQNRIRNLDADLPNRFNADPLRLFDVSGSAGKVAAFAVRVDTYPVPKRKQVFFLGTNDPRRFTPLRRHILKNFKELPEMGEYMNRGTFNTAERYGKDVFLSIKHLGTKRLPKAYALKSSAEYLVRALYYGHFMCHVFHRDYIFKKGTDLKVVKAKMLARLEAKGAKYPAEHNVGHLYPADEALERFYETLDPTNTFNPGIGKTDKKRRETV